MADKAFQIAMVFTSDTDKALSGATQVEQAYGKIHTQAGQTTSSIKGHSAALEKDAAAAREAAASTLKLSEAERKAREEASRPAPAPTAPNPANQPGSPPAHFGPEIPKQIQDMRAQYVPLFAAQRKYQAEVRNINAAHKTGAISAAEQSAALDRLKMSYDRQVAGIRTMDRMMNTSGKTMQLNAHQAQNLSYQLNNVVQSLALGMPIQQILLQQGPQITQIYGGVGNTFKALTASLTAGRLAMGGVAGAALVGASAWNSYLTSTKAVATAADGVGRAVAGTAQDMEAAAAAGAAAAGINMQAARAMQVQFLRTGKIGADSFEELIGLSRDFGATLGIEAAEVGGALADMFANPSEAADTLLNKYGLIDAATARNVRMLAAQNRENEARDILIQKLPDRLVKAEDATTALGRAWQFVKTSAGGAKDAIGQAIEAVAGDETQEELIARLEARIRAGGKTQARGRGHSRAKAQDKAEAEAELAAIRADIAAEEADAEKRARERLGRNALKIAEESPAVSAAKRREKLTNDLAALREGQDQPGLDDTQRQRITDVIEARSNLLDGLINKQARLLQLDRLDIQIQNERNPLIRAELEARRVRLQMAGEEVTADKIADAAAKARARSILEATGAAQAQAADMRTEVEVRGRLNALVASSAITTEQANRQLQEELRLRPLIAAAALAEGEEKAALQTIIEQLRDGYAGLEAQRTQASASNYLRSQERSLDKLKAEIALIGASAGVRARVLALMEAEQRIRSLGIDAASGQAGQIRQAARDNAELTETLERLQGAWGAVGDAAEGTIDKITDSLTQGDIGGALEGIAEEVAGLVSELAISNPLKNAILGTDYGTLKDVGGIGGIWDRLTGKNDAAKIAAQSQTMSTASMVINAGNVTLNGALGFGGGSGGVPGAANLNGVAARGGLSGKQGVQEQVWQFFAGKGLQPHQIAGIMGNVSAESGFNPTIPCDAGQSVGLFQHHKGRMAGLLNHIGGRGNLNDVQGQLEFAWKELQTTEAAAMRRLMASTNVREATSAFVGFERPQGWTPGNPEGALHFDRRLGAAQAAMTKFSTATDTATANLGNLGEGADIVGNILSNITGMAGGQGGGGGGSLLGSLISGIAGAAGLPGFRVGGATGGSDPSKVAGLVHEKEFVFDADATRRIGPANLEAIRKGSMRGYRQGGFVSSAAMPSVAGPSQHSGQSAPPIIINNYSGQEVTQEETVGPGGQRQPIISIGEQGAAAIAQRGNPMSRQIESQYGLKRQAVRR